MFAVKHVTDEKGNVLIQDPPIAQFLFSNTKAVHHLARRPPVRRVGLLGGRLAQAQRPGLDGPRGTGILGFWTRAAGVGANGQPVITYGWYRAFIQFLIDSNAAPWFSKVITFGELAVGARHGSSARWSGSRPSSAP